MGEKNDRDRLESISVAVPSSPTLFLIYPHPTLVSSLTQHPALPHIPAPPPAASCHHTTRGRPLQTHPTPYLYTHSKKVRSRRGCCGGCGGGDDELNWGNGIW